MRQERIFGSDVQLFRPERFLECSEDKKTEMSRTVDLVFGYGRWMCAGKTLALVELNKIFFEVCRAQVEDSLMKRIENMVIENVMLATES